MNLYELTTEAATLAALLDSDELSDEQRQQADELHAQILMGLMPRKVESYCHVIAQKEAEAEMLRAEEKRLAARRRVREGAASRMRGALHEALRATGERKIDAGKWTVSIDKSPVSLAVTDDRKIPAEYWRHPEPVIDRAALLAALKSGEAVDGAEIKTGTHLRIR